MAAEPEADSGAASSDTGEPRVVGAPAVRRGRRTARGRQARGRTIWMIGGVAFVLRLIWVLALVRIPSGLSDPFLYHGYAIRIASGRGYRSLVEDPTSYYPPGYPYFLGALYKAADLVGLDSHIDLVVGFTQSLLWAVAAMAVALTARWAFPGREGARASVAAGLVIACWPNLIAYAGAWLSESLFVALLAVAIAALTLSARSPHPSARWTSLALAALCLGGATMVRPQVLLGLPLVALAWLAGGLGWKRVLALAAAVAVAVAAFVVPWAIRNESVFGEVVLVSTNGGDNLCIGFHPGARGSFQFPIEYCDTGEFWNDGREAELRRDRDTRELAREYIVDEPLSLPWLSARKLFYTYRSDDDGLVGNESYGAVEVLGSPWRGIWLTVSHVAYALIMLASVAGIALSVRRQWRDRIDPAISALLGLTLAGMLLPVLVFGDPRFKVPTTPLFALFAGLAVAVAYAELEARRERPTR